MKIHHTVKGNTLSKLAALYKVTVKELLGINPDITNSDIIYVGQKIKIPAKAEKKQLNRRKKSHHQKTKLEETNNAAGKHPSGNPGKTTKTCAETSCTADAFILSKKDPNRKYKLELSKQKPKASPDNPNNVFQVISGWDESSASEMKLSVTKCPHGSDSTPCPTVIVKGKHVDEKITSSPGNFKVFCKEPSGSWATDLIPFPIFISNYLWPTSVEPNTYSVKTTGCKGHNRFNATVEAFTQVGWEGKLVFGLGYKSKSSADTANEKKGKFESTSSITGELAMTYGSRQYKIEAGFDKAAQRGTNDKGLSGLLKKGYDIVEGADFLKNLNDYSTGKKKIPGINATPSVKCTIDWPTIEIKGKAENVEIKDKFMVEPEYSFTIGGKLIGFTITGDILDFIAYFYCPALFKIKKAAADGGESKYVGAKAVIAIEPSLTGSVGIDLDCKYNAQEYSITGSVSASVGLGLKGEVYAEGHIWKVYAGAGAIAEFKSKKDASKNASITGTLEPVKYGKGKGFDWGGKIEFNGLAFYYALYAYAGTKSMKTQDTDKAKKKGRGIGRHKKGTSDIKASKELKKGEDLWQPWTMPESAK